MIVPTLTGKPWYKQGNLGHETFCTHSEDIPKHVYCINSPLSMGASCGKSPKSENIAIYDSSDFDRETMVQAGKPGT